MPGSRPRIATSADRSFHESEDDQRLLEQGTLDVLVPENVHRMVLRLSGHPGLTIVVGRKHLARRTWAFVYPDVAPLVPIGQGAYRIASHDGHTHFAWELHGDCAVCAEIGLEASGRFIVSVMNPDPTLWPDPQGELFDDRELTIPTPFPPALQQQFDGHRYLPLRPEFLDFAGAELVLIR